MKNRVGKTVWIAGVLWSAASAVLVLTMAVVCASASEEREHRPQGLSRLPQAAQSIISAALGRDFAAYRAEATERGFVFRSRGLEARFAPEGVALKTGDSRWNMTLDRYGRGDTLMTVGSVSPQAALNRVEYHRGAVTEWYTNGPMGLEQGFTIAKRTGNSKDGPLTLAIALSGNLEPALDATSKGLKLRGNRGVRMNYTGLSATDANGTELHAWLEIRGETLLVKVAEADAIYPLTIDPWVQLAELTSSDGTTNDNFAASVAIDGNTAVVGAEFANVGSTMYQGAAYVFVEPASGWSNATQTAKLTASDGAANALFGGSVAISGNTIIVGASHEEEDSHYNVGAAYIFVEPDGGWTDMTETAELKKPYAVHPVGSFGISVAIDQDTAVVGWRGTYSQGHAYVFVKPSTGWKTTSNFTADLTDTNSSLGFAVSLSISGRTIAVGANTVYIGVAGPGHVYVFVEPANGWASMTQTAELSSAIDYIQGAQLGFSVAVRDGIIVSGSPTSNPRTNIGAAYVYVEPVGGWADMTETAELKSSDGEDRDFFGSAVGINGSGDTVWIGAPGHNSSEGAVYVFVRPKDGWTTTNRFKAELVPSSGGQGFGLSLSISGDSALIGAPYTALNQGSAYVFQP